MTLSIEDISTQLFGLGFKPVDWTYEQGVVEIGTGLNGIRVRLKQEDLLGNALVLGRQGVGKTTLLTDIALQSMIHGIKTTWIDTFKFDGRALTRLSDDILVFRANRGEWKLNPLQLRTQLFVEIFGEVFQLPAGSRSSAFLHKWVSHIKEQNPRANLFHLMYFLEDQKLALRSYEAEARDVVLSRLYMLLDGDFGKCFDVLDDYPASVILSHNVVLELPPSQPLASFMTMCTLWKLIEYKISRKRPDVLTNIIIKDEAKTEFGVHHRDVRRTGTLEMLTTAVNIVREYGMAMIWADQSADALHPALLESSNVKILLPSAGEVIDRLKRNLEINTPQRMETAHRLQKGTGLVKIASRPTVVFRLRSFEYEKDVTDEELDERFRALPWAPVSYPERTTVESETESSVRIWNRFWTLYAKSGGILNLSEMASRIGINSSDISKLVRKVEADGLIEKRSFQTRQRLLELTKKGEKFCLAGGWFLQKKGKGGAVHRRHQYLIGRAMKRRGAKVFAEYEGFDLLVVKNGKRTGYEIVADTTGPDVTVHLNKAEKVEELVFLFESKREYNRFTKVLPESATTVRAVMATNFYDEEGVRPFVDDK